MGILDVMSTSTGGMSAQAYALGNISGNIANSTTPGYKGVESRFEDLLPDGGSGQSRSSGAVASYSNLTNTVAGTVTSTGVPTNMALSGSGYFVVLQDNGSGGSTPAFDSQSLYTRRGDFAPDANGYLRNGAGYYLAASTAGTGAGTTPLRITPNTLPSGSTLSSVSVGNDGRLVGTYSGGETKTFGTAAVANIPGSGWLQSEDGGAYSLTSQAGTPVIGLAGSTIQGGALEGSNTNITDQFSKLIATQQAYEYNSKILTSANEMLQNAINLMTV